MMDQTGADAEPYALTNWRRLGLAFSRDADGIIVAVLFAKRNAPCRRPPGLIADAHEKSSLPNLLPVDLLQVIDVLEDSAGRCRRTLGRRASTLLFQGTEPRIRL